MPQLSKEKHWNWKGGVTYKSDYDAQRIKKRRHELGISKRYNTGCGGYDKEKRKLWIKNNIEKVRMYKKVCKFKRRMAGILSVRTIQEVYEENIKFFGTLTCFYCFKKIEFGKDSIDHKTPIVRGGGHDKENLVISCIECNVKKNRRTAEEFKCSD